MAATLRDTANYTGELFLVGQNRTPLLSMIGGIDGSNAQYINGFQFPLASPWVLSSASQPVISEDASIIAGTPTTIARGQDVNTIQIFKQDVSVSYAKLISSGEIAGIANVGFEQRVKNELEFQKMAHLKQMALDMEYTFLNGVYQAAATTATAAKCKGIITGTTTNAVAGGAALLTKAMMDDMFKKMADSGSPFENVVVMVNSFQKQIISDIYGYQPESRSEGGFNIQTIYCDFGQVSVVYNPQVPASVVSAIEISMCKPVFAIVDGNAPVFYEDLAKTAMAQSGQICSFAGINYGIEEAHGKITGLATSK
jgi:hypothetical protein